MISKQSAAGLFQSVHGVLDDLNERLEQLVAVAPILGAIRLDRGFDANFLIVAAAARSICTLRCKSMHKSTIVFSPGSAGRNSEGSRPGRGCAATDSQSCGPARPVRWLASIRPELLGISHDRCQGMIDLVRRSGNQLAEGSQFLSLHQLALQSLLGSRSCGVTLRAARIKAWSWIYWRRNTNAPRTSIAASTVNKRNVRAGAGESSSSRSTDPSTGKERIANIASRRRHCSPLVAGSRRRAASGCHSRADKSCRRHPSHCTEQRNIVETSRVVCPAVSARLTAAKPAHRAR